MQGVFLLVLAAVLCVQAACPYQCEPHGTCGPSNVCVCNADYTGDDCSIWVTDLPLNFHRADETLSSKHWHYYKVVANDVSGLQVRVSQSSAQGDVDVYVQKTALPTRSNYLVRKVTGERSFSLDVDASLFSPGTWYVGCFAFKGVTYDLEVVPLSACPNGCSGHGQCSASSGSCACDPGFSGDDCSDGYAPVAIGQPPVSAHVARLEWAYFAVDVPAGQASFRVQTTQSSAAEDVDLYIRFNAVPTKAAWDARDVSVNAVSSVEISDPRAGRYFVGVFGYATTSFTIEAAETAASGATCPSACSGPSHGVCRNGVCQCEGCFEGDYCGVSVCDWSVGQTVQGQLERSGWNYYSLNVQSDNTLVVRLAETRGTNETALMDCDLYVRRERKPTPTQYDFADFGRGANSSVSLDSPMGLYWVGVYAFHNCQYEAVLEEGSDSDCPGGCSGHGACQGGDCVCEAPYSGVDCSVLESALVSGQAVTGAVTVNKWQYYNYTTDAPFVSVQLVETESVGSMWLFVSHENNPTLSDHDYQDMSFSSAFHSVNIRNSSGQNSYFIGVYGDPIMSSSAGRPFRLVVWNPS